MIKPTKKQLAFLTELGIVPPPTKPACGGIISYIVCGNGTFGSDFIRRVGITKNFQQKWLGKTVIISDARTKFYGQVGVVRYLLARRSDEVLGLLVTGAEHRPLPFRARLSFLQKEKRNLWSLGSLEIKDMPKVESC